MYIFNHYSGHLSTTARLLSPKRDYRVQFTLCIQATSLQQALFRSQEWPQQTGSTMCTACTPPDTKMWWRYPLPPSGNPNVPLESPWGCCGEDVHSKEDLPMRCRGRQNWTQLIQAPENPAYTNFRLKWLYRWWKQYSLHALYAPWLVHTSVSTYTSLCH